jgi:hypothetical protein
MCYAALAMTTATDGTSRGPAEVARAASLVIAEIEFPDFRTMLANCSSDSLRRLRRTLTCTFISQFERIAKVGRLAPGHVFTRDEGLRTATEAGTTPPWSRW